MRDNTFYGREHILSIPFLLQRERTHSLPAFLLVQNAFFVCGICFLFIECGLECWICFLLIECVLYEWNLFSGDRMWSCAFLATGSCDVVCNSRCEIVIHAGMYRNGDRYLQIWRHREIAIQRTWYSMCRNERFFSNVIHIKKQERFRVGFEVYTCTHI